MDYGHVLYHCRYSNYKWKWKSVGGNLNVVIHRDKMLKKIKLNFVFMSHQLWVILTFLIWFDSFRWCESEFPALSCPPGGIFIKIRIIWSKIIKLTPSMVSITPFRSHVILWFSGFNQHWTFGFIQFKKIIIMTHYDSRCGHRVGPCKVPKSTWKRSASPIQSIYTSTVWSDHC